MCPTTKAEMEEAARNKNCVSYAGNQNCTDPGKFKYHCVINVFRNETIEVCAPERKINGTEKISQCVHLYLNVNLNSNS